MKRKMAEVPATYNPNLFIGHRHLCRGILVKLYLGEQESGHNQMETVAVRVGEHWRL